MKKTLRFLTLFIFIFVLITLFLTYAYSEGHPEGTLWIKGGDITLTISNACAIPGEDFYLKEATNTSCKLFWSLGTLPSRKITVETNLDSTKFILKVLAVDISENSGEATGEITLSKTAQDFIIDIPWWPGKGLPIGHCTLRYTALAKAAQGTGKDIHTIIYTIIRS